MPAAWVDACRVKPFEALGNIEGACDHRVLVAKRLQLGFAGNRGCQRHRCGRILRHQLGQFVDLTIRHLEHTSYVAQHAPRLQRPEGNDLRDLIAAVTLLDIVDDFAAAVLAEVDIEVRHRDTFGIEKALEQQAEPDRIEIGNRQRIGHQRSCTGAAARPDRYALGFGVLDEIGHDQEVTGIVHAADNIEFERQPRAVIFFADTLGQTVDFEAVAQALLGLTAQLSSFVVFRTLRIGARTNRETRQDRLARSRPERTTLGNFHCRRQRFRNIGE